MAEKRASYDAEFRAGAVRIVTETGKPAAQLTAIDPDWNCPWPLDWQRHYAVLRDLVDADGTLPDIQPGVLFEGDDLGKWLERQRQASNWAQLSTEQQKRLTGLGVQPAERPSPAPAKKSAGRSGESVGGLPTRPEQPRVFTSLCKR
jgi:hypothetical protein